MLGKGGGPGSVLHPLPSHPLLLLGAVQPCTLPSGWAVRGFSSGILPKSSCLSALPGLGFPPPPPRPGTGICPLPPWELWLLVAVKPPFFCGGRVPCVEVPVAGRAGSAAFVGNPESPFGAGRVLPASPGCWGHPLPTETVLGDSKPCSPVVRRCNVPPSHLLSSDPGEMPSPGEPCAPLLNASCSPCAAGTLG